MTPLPVVRGSKQPLEERCNGIVELEPGALGIVTSRFGSAARLPRHVTRRLWCQTATTWVLAKRGFPVRRGRARVIAVLAKQVGTINVSADEKVQLRTLATAGISMAEAARRLHRHHSTVIRHARKLGLQWRRPPVIPQAPKPPKGPAGRRWTPDEDQRLRSLVAAGATIDRAAKDLDRQASLVWTRAHRLGLRWARSKLPI